MGRMNNIWEVTPKDVSIQVGIKQQKCFNRNIYMIFNYYCHENIQATVSSNHPISYFTILQSVFVQYQIGNPWLIIWAPSIYKETNGINQYWVQYISNYIHMSICGVIIHPYPNFNIGLAKLALMNNYATLSYIDVIICLNFMNRGRCGGRLFV